MGTAADRETQSIAGNICDYFSEISIWETNGSKTNIYCIIRDGIFK
jgi:hypothetical protein